MIKFSHWKQDTPKMQLAAISQDIENTLANMREGVGGDPMYGSVHVQRLSSELVQLAPWLRKGEWGQNAASFKVGDWYRHTEDGKSQDLQLTKISDDKLFFNDMSHTTIKEDMNWLVPIEDPNE